DAQSPSSEQATQSGNKRALADGRGGALNHEYRRQVAVTHANLPMISISRWHSAGNRQAMRMLLGRPKDAQSRTTRPWGNSIRRKLAPSPTWTRTKFAWDGWTHRPRERTAPGRCVAPGVRVCARESRRVEREVVRR